VKRNSTKVNGIMRSNTIANIHEYVDCRVVRRGSVVCCLSLGDLVVEGTETRARRHETEERGRNRDRDRTAKTAKDGTG